MTLREKAEAAANAIDWHAGPPTLVIADAIEKTARVFAEKAVRGLIDRLEWPMAYVVDPELRRQLIAEAIAAAERGEK